MIIANANARLGSLPSCNISLRIAVGVAIMISCLVSQFAVAAEIQIRAQSQCEQNVVTLSDVAIVLDADQARTDKLGKIPLFAAPLDGEQATVRASEIRDMLQQRGVNLLKHQFSGASQIVVTRGEKSRNIPQRATNRTNPTQRLEQLEAAIVSHLRRVAEESDRWEVRIDLGRIQKQELAKADSAVEISGGTAPWVGRQEFTVVFTTEGKSRELVLNANVTKPQLQIVVVRPLRRGQIIQKEDVSLQTPAKLVASRQKTQQVGYTSFEEVVGMEVKKSVSPGQPLLSGAVQRPIVVRRGEVVSIYARSAGIEIRSVGRAKDDGALDDLIEVESMDQKRTKLRARVSGVRTVDVLAEGSFITNSPGGNRNRRGR